MAHLACKKFAALFGLFAPRDVDENAEHDPLDYPGIIALATRGDPLEFVSDHDSKVDLVWTHNGTRRVECCANTIAIGGECAPTDPQI